jgi:hypothetical protein
MDDNNIFAKAITPGAGFGNGDVVNPVLASNLYAEHLQSKEKDDQEDQSDKVYRVKSLWLDLRQIWKPYFIEVSKRYRYLRGDQFTGKVKELMEERGLPEVKFNFLQKMVLYVAGMIAKNLSKITATPTKMGEEKKAKLHTVMTDWAMYGCDGEFELAKASTDASIAGIGWVNNKFDVKRNKWISEASAYYHHMFDPNDVSREDDYKCQHMTFDDLFTPEQIIRGYNLESEVADKVLAEAKNLEGREKTNKPYSIVDKLMTAVRDFLSPDWKEQRAYSSDDFCDSENGLYRVIELHERRMTRTRKLFNPITQELLEIPEEMMKDENLLQEIMKDYKGWLSRDTEKEEIWVITICPKLLPATLLFQGKHPIQGKGFQFKRVFCYDFDPSPHHTQSVLSVLLSVQDFINQHAVSYLTWILAGVMPDITYPKGAIAPDQIDNWKKRSMGKLKEYIGEKEPHREEPILSVGNALVQNQERAWDLISQMSFSPNQLGQSETSKESGTLFNQRVQAGMITLESLFAHIRRAQEQIWQYCDKNLQTFLTTPQIVRIAGEPPADVEGLAKKDADAYWLKVNWEIVGGYQNDLQEGDYDFHADQTQLGAMEKQLSFQRGMQLLETVKNIDPKAAAAIMPIIIRRGDDPDVSEIASRIEKVLSMEMGIQEQGQAMDALAKQQALMHGEQKLQQPQEQQVQNAAQERFQ